MGRILIEVENNEKDLEMYEEVINTLEKANYTGSDKQRKKNEGFQLSIDFDDKLYLVWNDCGYIPELLRLGKHTVPIKWIYYTIDDILDKYPNNIDVVYLLSRISFIVEKERWESKQRIKQLEDQIRKYKGN